MRFIGAALTIFTMSLFMEEMVDSAAPTYVPAQIIRRRKQCGECAEEDEYCFFICEVESNDETASHWNQDTYETESPSYVSEQRFKVDIYPSLPQYESSYQASNKKWRNEYDINEDSNSQYGRRPTHQRQGSYSNYDSRSLRYNSRNPLYYYDRQGDQREVEHGRHNADYDYYYNKDYNRAPFNSRFNARSQWRDESRFKSSRQQAYQSEVGRPSRLDHPNSRKEMSSKQWRNSAINDDYDGDQRSGDSEFQEDGQLQNNANEKEDENNENSAKPMKSDEFQWPEFFETEEEEIEWPGLTTSAPTQHSTTATTTKKKVRPVTTPHLQRKPVPVKVSTTTQSPHQDYPPHVFPGERRQQYSLHYLIPEQQQSHQDYSYENPPYIPYNQHNNYETNYQQPYYNSDRRTSHADNSRFYGQPGYRTKSYPEALYPPGRYLNEDSPRPAQHRMRPQLNSFTMPQANSYSRPNQRFEPQISRTAPQAWTREGEAYVQAGSQRIASGRQIGYEGRMFIHTTGGGDDSPGVAIADGQVAVAPNQFGIGGGQVAVEGRAAMGGGQIALRPNQMALSGSQLVVSGEEGGQNYVSNEGQYAFGPGQYAYGGGQYSFGSGDAVMSQGQMMFNGKESAMRGGHIVAQGHQVAINAPQIAMNGDQMAINGGQLVFNGGSRPLALTGGVMSLTGNQVTISAPQLTVSGLQNPTVQQPLLTHFTHSLQRRNTMF